MAVKRQANFELLRIVAMVMIIILHYLGKGNIITPYRENASVFNYIGWLIEAFCIVCVNCYVLISGYFLVESGWKPRRILSLEAQILFYSVLIPIAMLCTRMIVWSEISVYDWAKYIFPMQSELYWFATHYMVLYLFVPILAAGVQKLEKKTLQIIILFLLLLFSVGKTILPINLAIDMNGYHYGWFLYLFLVAAYIRKYGIPWLEKGKRGLVIYIVMCVGVWAVSAFCGMVERKTGSVYSYTNMPYSYNHFFVFAGSVGLFCMFMKLRIKEGKAAFWIRKLAPYTFGIYLLHNHILIADKWMVWMGIEKVRGTWLFIPHMIACVLVVYLIGTIVDFARAYLFAQIGKLWEKRGNERKDSKDVFHYKKSGL